MDLETENRLAALLMEEARRLRMQAEKEGVHAYLRKPNVRTRPNSRFLTATVLGVQQANRAVEVREMWHARAKEIEIEAKHHSRSREERYSGRSEKHHHGSFRRSRQQRNDGDSAISCSSNKMGPEDHYSSEDGSLRDDEVEEFLQSRAKRGRGAIGSRMDEPGPYPSSTASGQGGVDSEERLKGVAECRTFGPEKPSFFRSDESHKGNSSGHVSGNDTCSSGKHHSKENDTCSLWRHHSKEKQRKKDKSDGAKRKKHKSKHHRKSRRID